eukprot:1907869-Alexandrium_andersonii.AAC.1
MVVEDAEEDLLHVAPTKPAALGECAAEGVRHLLRGMPVRPAAEGAEDHSRASRLSSGGEDGLYAAQHELAVLVLH